MQVDLPEKEVREPVVRVGHRCQSFLREKDLLVAERWEWTGEGEGKGWQRKAVIGNRDGSSFPEDVLTENFGLAIGETMSVDGLPWKVIEKSEKAP
jgi:hypothetical protein